MIEVRFLLIFAIGLMGNPVSLSENKPDRPVRYPTGDYRPTTVDDIRPDDRVKHEMWSYRFQLNGDTQLFIDFRKADLGTFKGKVLGADFAVVGLKGNQHAVSREYPNDNLTFDNATHRLSVHPNIWFEGKLPRHHVVHYETRKAGVSYFAHLTFTDIATGGTWGDGVFGFGDDETMGVTIPIPYARVSGKIAVDGDTMQVSGTGYMDHVTQTDKVSKLVDAGYRVVSHTGGWDVGLYLTPTKKYDATVVGFGLSSRRGYAALFKATELSVREMGRERGDDLPTTLEVRNERGESKSFQRSRNLQRLSLLREVGGLKKFVAKKIAGGDVIMFRGVGLIDHVRAMAYDYFIVD